MSAVALKKSRHRLFIGVLAALVVGGGIAALFIRTSDAPKKKAAPSSVINITLPPPLPPPPPPPPPPQNEPPPPEEQKMVEQEPVAEEEKPPEAPSPEQPPSDLTTNLKGDGANNFGLSQGSGRGGNGIGGNGTGRGGSKWGFYASGVQRSISDAVRRHSSTRNATFSIKVRIWPDATGRITRAQLVDSTGNPSLDEVLKNQVLTGVQLNAAPPADMPLPIVMRLSARKP